MLSRSRRRYRGIFRSAKASTICWDVKAAEGCSVTPKCSTSRRRCSNTMNTKRNLQGDRGYGEEIDRNHLAEVIVEERLPGLAGRPRQFPEDAGDSTLGDLDAE